MILATGINENTLASFAILLVIVLFLFLFFGNSGSGGGGGPRRRKEDHRRDFEERRPEGRFGREIIVKKDGKVKRYRTNEYDEVIEE